MKYIARFLLVIMLIVFSVAWFVMLILFLMLTPILILCEYILRGTWDCTIDTLMDFTFGTLPDWFYSVSQNFMTFFLKK